MFKKLCSSSIASINNFRFFVVVSYLMSTLAFVNWYIWSVVCFCDLLLIKYSTQQLTHTVVNVRTSSFCMAWCCFVGVICCVGGEVCDTACMCCWFACCWSYSASFCCSPFSTTDPDVATRCPQCSVIRCSCIPTALAAVSTLNLWVSTVDGQRIA